MTKKQALKKAKGRTPSGWLHSIWVDTEDTSPRKCRVPNEREEKTAMKAERVKVNVSYVYSSEYTDYGFSYYGTVHYTHIFKDADGYTYVWKTTSFINLPRFSKIELTGTVKEVSEYNGEPQTILTRCKYTALELAKTKEQLDAEKRKQQLASIGKNDILWTMPYRQYKEHYADCETLAGSYNSMRDPRGYSVGQPTIGVIIREGRLKASGTRGKHYHTWVFQNIASGASIYFYAISEDTATKQLIRAGYDPANYKEPFVCESF